MPVLLERTPIAQETTAAPVGKNVSAVDARRSPEPPAPPADVESPTPAQLICSGCYLTEAELNRTGLLGCARCYETFASVIASAAEILHGVRVPNEWAEPKPRHTVTNPWPTRRGVRIESP
jgi:hypothetical protein